MSLAKAVTESSRGGGLAFRHGLLPATAFGVAFLTSLLLEDAAVGESKVPLLVLMAVAGSSFSCELAGSMASLLGTGVDSFTDGLDLGRELALVVSVKHEG